MKKITLILILLTAKFVISAEKAPADKDFNFYFKEALTFERQNDFNKAVESHIKAYSFADALKLPIAVNILKGLIVARLTKLKVKVSSDLQLHLQTIIDANQDI
jgi:hypothetical protein